MDTIYKQKLESNIGKFYLHNVLSGMFFSVPVMVLFWQTSSMLSINPSYGYINPISNSQDWISLILVLYLRLFRWSPRYPHDTPMR